MRRQLTEQGAILESKGGSTTIPIRIISEGKGSSAVYTREFLEKNKDIFANRPMWVSHPGDTSKPWQRDVDKIAARTGKTVEYKIIEGIAGLYTEAKPRAEYRELLEGFGDLFGISIFAPESDGSEDSDGNYIVESVIENPLISVDFVPAGGRDGRVLTLVESLAAIEQSSSSSTTSVLEEKDKKMDEKLDKLLTLLESFVAESKAKATESVQAKVDAEAVQKAVAESVESYDAKVKLITEADLLPSQSASLREAAKRGEDVAPLIEDAKKVREEAKALVESVDFSGGRTLGGASDDWNVSGVRF